MMNRSRAIALVSFLLMTAAAHSQGAAAGLAQRASLDGGFASELEISGGPWLATQPGELLTLTFTAEGLAGVKQFNVVVRLEPPAAFDIASAIFRTEDPFLDPFPNGVVLPSDEEVDMGAAILGLAVVDGVKTLGTLTIQTSDDFDPAQPARLVIQSFSIGPSSTDRDNYGEDDLELGVLVTEVPSVIGDTTWGSMKATGGP